MILVEDVHDDLMEAFPDYYRKEGMTLVYQNGKDNDKYLVEVKVYRLGLED